MALTVTLQQLQKVQLQGSPYGTADFIQVAVLTYDSSYPSGGYPITASAFNLNTVLGMTQIGTSANATPTVAYYDKTNATLRVYGFASSFTSNNISATLSTMVEIPVGSATLANVSPTFLVVGA